jgi:mRNA-degrading endonuclease RelE of RelBE toxin-antitoxin system
MSYEVIATPDFVREVKKIAKKHKGIKADIAKLIEAIELNPTMGTDLGGNFYKIRLSISNTNKGKSGGARIITCVLFVKEIVYLSDIYLKSEVGSVDTNVINQRLHDLGLI